jgi:NAD(P)-dependent dehydrogenase (short-subunit alcohol dehydrogenase family)
MARIFITGSADGLGQMAARLMAGDGHRVALHVHNEKRAKQALASVPEGNPRLYLTDEVPGFAVDETARWIQTTPAATAIRRVPSRHLRSAFIS